MNKTQRHTLFARLHDANPHPTTELIWQTPFELLIAVVLSAQSTDVGVNKATHTLFAVANTPEAMVALGLEGIKEHIRTLGLYNNKARHIIALCEQLIALHSSSVPHSRAALEALPGVGRKTANVVLNTAFGEPTLAVDTHIFRVANRTGLAAGSTVKQVEQHLLDVVPTAFLQDAHHWLILHGRYTCKARKPLCGSCLIEDLCEYSAKTEPAPE